MVSCVAFDFAQTTIKLQLVSGAETNCSSVSHLASRNEVISPLAAEGGLYIKKVQDSFYALH